MNTFILLVCLGVVRTQEVATPSSMLKPRNYNYHAEQTRQYLDRLNKLLGPVPTRKGPVLFPPSPEEASQPAVISKDAESGNTFQQNYFASLTQYKPVTLSADTLAPSIADDYVYDQAPYTDIEKKSIGNDFGNHYNEFETRTALPISSALAQNAQQTTQRSYPIYDYQSNIRVNQHDNNDVSEEIKNSENETDKSYAFSYTVKDQKTGDDFSHSQQSSGSATNGEYRVKLPDGRTQIVSYTADENGYKADVRYETDSNVINRKDYDYKLPIKTDKTHTKEYYNDYSAEYINHEPYQSKFAIFENDGLFDLKHYTSTVKPNLQLEDVLSEALPNVRPTLNYQKDTTDNVVLIGNRNSFKNPSDSVSFINPTPRNYLVSTIASLRNRISSKPILSDSFINRINKYLTFN